MFGTHHFFLSKNNKECTSARDSYFLVGTHQNLSDKDLREWTITQATMSKKNKLKRSTVPQLHCVQETEQNMQQRKLKN